MATVDQVEQQKEEAPWAFNTDKFVETKKKEATDDLFQQLNKKAQDCEAFDEPEDSMSKIIGISKRMPAATEQCTANFTNSFNNFMAALTGKNKNAKVVSDAERKQESTTSNIESILPKAKKSGGKLKAFSFK